MAEYILKLTGCLDSLPLLQLSLDELPVKWQHPLLLAWLPGSLMLVCQVTNACLRTNAALHRFSESLQKLQRSLIFLQTKKREGSPRILTQNRTFFTKIKRNPSWDLICKNEQLQWPVSDHQGEQVTVSWGPEICIWESWQLARLACGRCVPCVPLGLAASLLLLSVFVERWPGMPARPFPGRDVHCNLLIPRRRWVEIEPLYLLIPPLRFLPCLLLCGRREPTSVLTGGYCHPASPSLSCELKTSPWSYSCL